MMLLGLSLRNPENLKSSSEGGKEEEEEESKESDYDEDKDQLEEEQEDEASEIRISTINQIFISVWFFEHLDFNYHCSKTGRASTLIRNRVYGLSRRLRPSLLNLASRCNWFAVTYRNPSKASERVSGHKRRGSCTSLPFAVWTSSQDSVMLIVSRVDVTCCI
jgi:hypothetical protein